MDFLKDHKYFFLDGDKVEELEYDTSDEKYLLNDNSSEAQIARRFFYEDQKFCLNKDFKDKSKKYYLGDLSKLVAVIPFYLYSDEEYNQKYPNGIYVDGMVALPLNLYSEMLENEFKNDIKSPQIFFLKAITSVIEKKYNISFTDDDFKKIVEYTFNYLNEPYLALLKKSLEDKNSFSRFDLEHVDFDTFIKQFELDGFSEYSIRNLAEFKSNDDYIDSILINSKEVNDPEHPFYKIKDKITFKNLVFSEQEKNDITQLFENVRNKNLRNLPIINHSANDIVKIMNWLDEIAEENISSVLKVNGSNQDIADKLSELCIPLIFSSYSNTNFKLALSNLVKLVEDKFPNLINFEISLFETMVLSPYSYTYYGELSDFLSGYQIPNDNFNRPRVEVLEEKDYQYRQKYFSACSSGTIEMVQDFFENPNFDCSVEKHKGFLLALKHGNVEIIDYFLNNELFKDNISEIYKYILEPNNHYDEKTIAYFYDNEKISKDLNVLEKYQANYNYACQENSIVLVNKLNAFPGGENLLYEKIEGLRCLCSIKEPNLEIIINIMEHINPMIDRITCTNTKSYINDKLKNCLKIASENENYDICRYFIFDYNLKIDQEYIDSIKKDNKHKFEEVEKFLALRDLNTNLTNEFSKGSTSKVKKHKL